MDLFSKLSNLNLNSVLLRTKISASKTETFQNYCVSSLPDMNLPYD